MQKRLCNDASDSFPRFQELSSLLDPERPPKVDKSVILTDAARMVIQLRDEAQKLKESCERLHKKVDELKVCDIVYRTQHKVFNSILIHDNTF